MPLLAPARIPRRHRTCAQSAAVPQVRSAAAPLHPAQEHGPGGKRFTFCIGKDASQPQRSRFLMAAKQVRCTALRVAVAAPRGCAATEGQQQTLNRGGGSVLRFGRVCGGAATKGCRRVRRLVGWADPMPAVCSPAAPMAPPPISRCAGRARRGAPVPQQPLPRPAVRAPALQHVCHPGAPLRPSELPAGPRLVPCVAALGALLVMFAGTAAKPHT